MKKSELKVIIREIVREEVKMEVNKLLTETKVVQPKKTIKKKQKRVVKEKKHFTKNKMLNNILNETVNEEWETLGGRTMTTEDMGTVLANAYGDVTNKSAEQEMIASMGVNPETVPDHVSNALTKDYSKLMKAINEKK